METFETIYKKYSMQVYKFLLSLTMDENQAEELLQETFYQAYLHIDSFEGRCSLYTWLCQIGKNAWIKECKRRARFDRAPVEEHELISGGTLPEDKVIGKDEAGRAKEIIYHLCEPYRSVFIMKVFGELKLKDIAASFQKTESWARVTFYRAKKMIVEKMEE